MSSELILHPNPEVNPSLTPFEFAMEANGYVHGKNAWIERPGAVDEIGKGYRGEETSFFGPNYKSPFFSGNLGEGSDQQLYFHRLKDSLSQPDVLKMIGRYQNLDPEMAARLAYILGGIVRNQYKGGRNVDDQVDFVAEYTNLGQPASAESIALPTALYVISGGRLIEDPLFRRWTFDMSGAIEQDPVDVFTTSALGLSQVARLRAYYDLKDGLQPREFPDITDDLNVFKDFPTVGAEFHIRPNDARNIHRVYKKLALLNMSQHQRGSYVQMSRKDDGVIEIRMNPSVYPVTVANYRYMKQILPELEDAFFTITVARTNDDYRWTSDSDAHLLKRIRGLAFLSYAAVLENDPRQETKEQINFGDTYLAQVVRKSGEKFDLSGGYQPGNQGRGQLGVYAGFRNFNYLAFYASMAAVHPDLVGDVVDSIRDLPAALKTSSGTRKSILTGINNRIAGDERAMAAVQAGERIISALNF